MIAEVSAIRIPGELRMQLAGDLERLREQAWGRCAYALRAWRKTCYPHAEELAHQQALRAEQLSELIDLVLS